MKGRIVKALADFYYVYSLEEGSISACKAKGIFRRDKQTPLVGDLCEFEYTHTRDIEGNITAIEPRHSRMTRPAVSNVDQIMVVFAVKNPDPVLLLLDRILVTANIMQLPAIIVFNKQDTDEGAAQKYLDLYTHIGYRCFVTSAVKKSGLDELSLQLKGKLSAVAGPSGAGKSSLINALKGQDVMETGDVSLKTGRGRQTTRHTELVLLGEDTFIIDTPGFSSTDILGIPREELDTHFPEFAPYIGSCRFSGCAHISEPDCSIKAALEDGKLFRSRYEHYTRIYDELMQHSTRRFS